MFPHLQVKSTENDNFLDTIITVIESMNCKEYFSEHLSQKQTVQKTIVTSFQKALCLELVENVSVANWEIEYSPNLINRDAIDIFGSTDSSVIVIELDKHRADQVAKKFVSRIAILPETKVYYISFCYPGTASMSKAETIKYFGYCSKLAKRMNNEYAAFTVE